jgi:hypothetical protein
VIGTDVQNTTLPDKKPAKAIPAAQKREMIKALVSNRVRKGLMPSG